MAVTTWDGSANQHWDDAANWDTGSVPTDADDVIIPDTSEISNPTLRQNQDVKSLTIGTDGTLVGAGHTITIDAKNGSNFSLDNQGIIDGTLNVKVTGDGGHIREQGAGSINNLEVDLGGSSETHRLSDSITIANLTITEGDFQPNGRNLTVTGATIVGVGGGSADVSTLTCSSGNIELRAGSTAGLGLHVKQGGTFVGGSGTHTIGSISVDNNAAAKCTFSSGATELNGHGGSGLSNRIIIGGADSVNTAAGTQTITTASAYNLESSVNDLINNLVLNSNQTATMTNTLMIAGNLTISQGTLTTSGSDYALTVTGDVSVTGTLTGNESAIRMGSLTIAAAGTYSATNQTTTITDETGGGYAIYNTANGTFTHNNGMVAITTDDSVTKIFGMEGDDTSGTGANALNRLQIELGSSSQVLALEPAAGSAHVIKGNVTVAEGHFYVASASASLSIEGDVSVESGGTLGHADRTGADTFESVTISSGGTAIATSGTTTITSETSGGKAYENDGTFTHNNGTVLLHADIGDTEVYAGSSLLYNLTSSTGNNVWLKENITIANDLTVTSGTFGSGGGNARTVTVYGNAFISGGQLGNGSETGAYTVKGLVTLTGGTFDLSSGTINLGGIRNAGGTIA